MASEPRQFTRQRIRNPNGGDLTVRVENTRPVTYCTVDVVDEDDLDPDRLAGVLLRAELASRGFATEGAVRLDEWRGFPLASDGPLEVVYAFSGQPDLELVLWHYPVPFAPIPRRIITRREYVAPPQRELLLNANRNFNCPAGTTVELQNVKSDYSGWAVDASVERETPANLYLWINGNTATATDLILEIWTDNAVGGTREIAQFPFAVGGTGRAFVRLDAFPLPPLATSFRVRNTTGAPITVDFCVWARPYS